MCKLKLFKWTWPVYEPKQKINANHDTWKNSFYSNVIQGCNMIADNNLKITIINIQKIQKIPLFHFQPAVCAHPNVSLQVYIVIDYWSELSALSTPNHPWGEWGRERKNLSPPCPLFICYSSSEVVVCPIIYYWLSVATIKSSDPMKTNIIISVYINNVELTILDANAPRNLQIFMGKFHHQKTI